MIYYILCSKHVRVKCKFVIHETTIAVVTFVCETADIVLGGTRIITIVKHQLCARRFSRSKQR